MTELPDDVEQLKAMLLKLQEENYELKKQLIPNQKKWLS